MGLHISRIEIRNFRNFRHLVIDDFPAHAVIVGENGVGKSNLLEAIRLVLDPSISDARRMLREEDIWEGHPAGIAGGADVTIVVELRGFDDDADAKSILSSATVDFDPYVARLTYRFAPRTEIATAEGSHVQPTDQPLTAKDYDVVVFAGDRETNDVRAIRREVALRVLPALRDAEGDLQNWRRSPMRDLLERLPLDPVNLEATASAIATAVDQLTKDGNVTKLEGHLTDRLGAMFGPGLAVQPTLGFASSKPDELIRAVRLFFDTARTRSISDTSLGSANVIYLGLLLEALSQQQLDEEFIATLVAVEEPEAHLHVTLQRHLFRYLLRNGPSLMLTTHSPHIAAVAPVRSFIVLRATENGTTGATMAALPVSDKEAADLERYLDVSRAEVLFASAVVLVEGLAELYILPALADAAGFDLDAYGTVVASAHGTDFKPYRALLGPKGLDTPHVVITDGDATLDKRGVREAGLKRCAKLHPQTARRTALLAKIRALPETSAADYRTTRDPLVSELQNLGLYVGTQTLETDLCPLFGDEIIQALKDLSSNTTAIDDVSRGVANEQNTIIDPELRKKMLKRIGALGKGRFAQRLAAYIAQADLEGRIRAATKTPRDLPLDEQALRRLGTASYLFLAMERISLAVRGTSLLPASTAPLASGQASDAGQ
ncbi:AAA family ATPase [Streptomyces sp. SID8359]|uniref:ATP-dependent nuclease n=1 Tax=unclassified Streptomyces TaxID=2593676 RepID=UPI00067AA12E|nr:MULTISPECIES: AAA family ATPase [unclassified Streptomyces]MYT91909.1 AAA family ATPase [Streptomyces sp. SID8359]MYT93093.1 AAA family ATPase [Streptomyces sp. SID8359]